MKKSNIIMSTYVFVLMLYCGYEWWTYSGLYKFFAELQIKYWGYYYSIYTSFAIYLVLMMIGGFIIEIFVRRKEQNDK